MTVQDAPPDPIVALGYTPREADFLRLVARHGGYFVMRQFCAAIGRGHGRMTVAFARKVVRRRDATVQTFCRATRFIEDALLLRNQCGPLVDYHHRAEENGVSAGGYADATNQARNPNVERNCDNQNGC